MLQIFSLYNIEQKTYGKPMYYMDEDHACTAISIFFDKNKEHEEIDPANFELHHIGNFSEKEGIINIDDLIQAPVLCGLIKTPQQLQDEIQSRIPEESTN